MASSSDEKLDEVFGNSPPEFDYHYHDDPPEQLTEYEDLHYDDPEEDPDAGFDFLTPSPLSEVLEYCLPQVVEQGTAFVGKTLVCCVLFRILTQWSSTKRAGN